MKEKKYSIYNKSSENMSEIPNNSIDLIISSIPFNIGTKYPNHICSIPFEDYTILMNKIIKECYRVIKQDGTIIFEVADSVLMDGKFIMLSALIQSICAKNILHLFERHINFIFSENGKEKVNSRYVNDKFIALNKNAWSSRVHWLVFSKKKNKFSGGKIFYFDYYIDNSFHPVPFPDKICTQLLNMYYHKLRPRVLDPFMGTATLGTHVINKRGNFLGYEIDIKSFNEAKRKLKEACNGKVKNIYAWPVTLLNNAKCN